MHRRLSCWGPALALVCMGVWSGLWTAGCAAPVEDASPRSEALGARPGGPHAGWRHALTRDEAAGVTRTVIAGDIVEYAAELRVGPGEYDRIGIHRVVRERAPWRPIRARDGVMFVHGSASNFRSAAAPGLFAPDLFEDDFGLAPHLASQGIDVWGIDLRWTFVPLEETDFSDMQGWTLGSHVEDLRRATAIARIVRAATGSGRGRLFFSGHSLGADIVYAYANAETQRPRWRRDVRGLIPIDIIYKLTSPETQGLRDDAANRYAANRALYDAGTYEFGLGAQLAPLIGAGLSAPSDPSPLAPGWTNLQAATAVFTNTYLFYAPLPAYTPHYHFSAGVFDPSTGAPVGCQHVDALDMLQVAQRFPPYQALIEAVEIDALISGAVDVPYDDHLHEITVPVLHVGAAGGFGAAGAETLSLLGSTDTTAHIVQLQPPGAEVIDYGHVDLLWAADSEALVWQPIADWIATR